MKFGTKLKESIKQSAGPLTAKGRLADYQEIHALGLGLIHGIMMHKANYERVVDWASENNEDVKKETHYYEAGYFVTNRIKWIGTGLIGSGLI